MKVAITGGTGYVGRQLAAAHLARGDSVRLLTRRRAGERPEMPGELVWVEGDLRDTSLQLDAFTAGVDVLYHCAGEIRDVGQMRALHVDGTRRLVDAAAGQIGRWVQLSSVGVYGPRRDGTVTEETPPRPEGTYEETKTAADAVVEEASAAGRLHVAILRPSIVFGPGMRNDSVRQWIRIVKRGLFFFIGPPGASANYVPVQSTVEALLACGTHEAAVGLTFNLSEHATVEQFVRWIVDECQVPGPRMRLPEAPVRLVLRLLGRLRGFPLTPSRVAALTTRVRYPQTKIEQMLGFRPTTSLESAVRATVREYLETSP